jgi:heme/copper-type cytochrome/quinol oxidase subunit 2
MSASPNNPLVEELTKLYTYLDPINISKEYSRDLVYTNSSLLKFTILQDIWVALTQNLTTIPLNLNLYNNFLFIYFIGNDNSNSNFINFNDSYKNQYRPIKKGVINMVKLHATGAIAMPIETRLHLLASSKDVIHSWAIPSAGIKIDCVPGYSSHRIMIFLVSGIF